MTAHLEMQKQILDTSINRARTCNLLKMVANYTLRSDEVSQLRKKITSIKTKVG